MTVGWVDASSGASGDMLLGALAGVGVPVEVMAAAVDLVAPEPVRLSAAATTRAGLAATRMAVEVGESHHHRTWRDIAPMLDPLPDAVRAAATATFTRLAEAEARVHGGSVEDVHFHEVGALDAIADVVGVCAGLVHLGLDALVVSPVALGGGRVRASHGSLPVPVPAVVELLRGVPSYGGPLDVELCTPTGAALLTAHATGWGRQPAMVVEQVGAGAGGRDPEGHPNVLRLLVGQVLDRPAGAVVLETNVDDLDPRVWPSVIEALLAAGASDAWLTPILMKKGRPAHTLHVLARPDLAEAVGRVVLTHTTAIGLRTTEVAKTALDRRTETVEVLGHPVRVKVASLGGEVLNVMPEYDDVARAAGSLGRPVGEVLLAAHAAAGDLR